MRIPGHQDMVGIGRNVPGHNRYGDQINARLKS